MCRDQTDAVQQYHTVYILLHIKRKAKRYNGNHVQQLGKVRYEKVNVDTIPVMYWEVFSFGCPFL